MNLNVFLGRESMPNFRVVSPPDGKVEELRVDPSVCRRPAPVHCDSMLKRHF